MKSFALAYYGSCHILKDILYKMASDSKDANCLAAFVAGTQEVHTNLAGIQCLGEACTLS
jgi:hypothetical protein